MNNLISSGWHCQLIMGSSCNIKPIHNILPSISPFPSNQQKVSDPPASDFRHGKVNKRRQISLVSTKTLKLSADRLECNLCQIRPNNRDETRTGTWQLQPLVPSFWVPPGMSPSHNRCKKGSKNRPLFRLRCNRLILHISADPKFGQRPKSTQFRECWQFQYISHTLKGWVSQRLLC